MLSAAPLDFDLGGRDRFQQRHRVGADPEQQRPEFVVKLARHILPLVVLQRHDLPQQSSVVLAEAIESAGEFVGFLSALANLGRAGGSNRLLVVARSHSGQAVAQVLQRSQCRARGEMGNGPRQQHQANSGAGDREKSNPLLVDVGGHVRRKDDVADLLSLNHDGEGGFEFGQDEEADEPLRHRPQRGLHLGRVNIEAAPQASKPDCFGGAERLHERVQRRLRIIGGLKRSVERSRDGLGRASGRFGFLHKLRRGKDLERNASGQQSRREHQAERQQQPRAQRKSFPYLDQYSPHNPRFLF